MMRLSAHHPPAPHVYVCVTFQKYKYTDLSDLDLVVRHYIAYIGGLHTYD